MPTTHALTAADNGKRVRLVLTGTDTLNVQIGNPAENWTVGCFIEIVRVSSQAQVSIVAFNETVTVNFLSGTSQLKNGEYARVSMISPNTWDVHVYRIPALLLSDLDDVQGGAPTGSTLIYDGSIWIPTFEPWLTKSAPVKSAPLVVQTLPATLTSMEVGWSLEHEVHYRTTATTDVSVNVMPSIYWTGNQEYWQNNFNPYSPGPMPIGGTILFGKHGAGNVTFVPGAGVVINTPDTLSITNLHGKATLIKVGPDEWDLEGNIGA